MPRITGKDAEGLMAAYAKVHLPKEDEVAIEEPISETPAENIQEQGRLKDNPRVQALRKSAQPFMNQGKVTVSSNNSSGTPQRITPQPGSGSRTVAPGTIGRLLPNHPGNTGGGQQARPTQQAAPAPQARPVQQSGGARSAGEKIGGAIGGGIDRGIARARGGLSALGNLAGRAVGAVKQGVQSGVNTAKRVAGGVADAATGNLTDFDKRGGKPQGLSRVVAGGVDKLTGDRTDLDKRGVTPLNAGQRAQFQKKPAPAAAASAGAASQSAQPAQAAPKPQAAPKAEISPQRARRDARMAKIKARGNPRLRAQLNKGTPVNQLFQNYEMEGDYFDETINWLVNEGHVEDVKEAISIMSEPEFMESFNLGLSEVLNESSENNK